VVVSPGGWVRKQALWTAICPISGSTLSSTYCQPICLSRLCLLKVHWDFSSVPFPISLVCSVPPAPSAVCPFQFLVYYSVWDFFWGGAYQFSKGLWWFIPGVAVGILHAAYLLTCWPASPMQVWSLCLVVREPSCFLSVTWHGEALYWLVVGGVRGLLLLGGFFSAKCGSSVSARFLIYRAHTVCFLPLVTILDPPSKFFIVHSLMCVKICHVSNFLLDSQIRSWNKLLIAISSLNQPNIPLSSGYWVTHSTGNFTYQSVIKIPQDSEEHLLLCLWTISISTSQRSSSHQ
jgi:hypothetical protein